MCEIIYSIRVVIKVLLFLFVFLSRLIYNINRKDNKDGSIIMESINTIYRISINPVPELINNVPMYFWCILCQHENFEVNCGHGWADNILSAAKEAQHYYETIINPHNSSSY